MLCPYCTTGEMLPALKLGKSWLKCAECGATWSEEPKKKGKRRKAKK